MRAFLRRTIEGCQRIAQLDRDYNLRASVRHGATIAAMNAADMAGLESAYKFMEDANFRALMPVVGKRHAPFFQMHSARELQKTCGTAEDFYAGGVTDFFGGSFHPRKLLNGLARSLRNKGVRFFQETEAQALDFPDHRVTVFCENGAAIQADQVFMANAYARHINGDALERAIFLYDYVVVVELPERSNVLTGTTVLSDTRDPCFYARRQAGGSTWAMSRPRNRRPKSPARWPARRWRKRSGYSPHWAYSASMTSPAPGAAGCSTPPTTIRSSSAAPTAASRPSRRRRITAIRSPPRSGNWSANLPLTRSSSPLTDEDGRSRHRVRRQLKLFEGFPKGLRLRPGMRYQEAASDETAPLKNPGEDA